MSTENIDWSKAPEGATHWGPDTGEWSRAWRIIQGKQMAVMLDDGEDTEWTWYSITDEHRENLFPTLVARQAAWSGEGLPPVGTVCEALRIHHGKGWVKVTILGVGKSRIFWTDDRGEEMSRFISEVQFRPIKTAEQIAAEERQARIEQMLADIGETDCGPVIGSVVAALYDAGYRKLTGEQP